MTLSNIVSVRSSKKTPRKRKKRCQAVRHGVCGSWSFILMKLAYIDKCHVLYTKQFTQFVLCTVMRDTVAVVVTQQPCFTG